MMSRGYRGSGVIEGLLRPSFCVWILSSCRPPPCPVLPFVIPVSRLSARAHLHHRVGATNEEWFFGGEQVDLELEPLSAYEEPSN